MTNLSVIGLQWGDEGKGKIVDYLSEYVNTVVRFQGGNNAGHTLVIGGTTYKLNLLPSGIVREKVLAVIDQGVVIDPYALLDEIKNMPFNITKERLIISEDCHLVLKVHKELDEIYEKWRSEGKIGTTGKGIGPCYEDKVARRGIRICDVYDDNLIHKVKELMKYHNTLRKGIGISEIDPQEMVKEIREVINEISQYVVGRNEIFDIFSTKTLLFEGAQGCLLDIGYGTYPFVTSSSTIGAIFSTDDDFILGVAKAYTTRVGNGVFPTEQENEIGTKLREIGREVGTVSGRQRRCGWFDAVLIRYAAKISNTHGVALTKLDVLDGMDEIKICTHYKYNEKTYDYLPSMFSMQPKLEPIYETLPGWKESTCGLASFDKLPKNAINYIRRIEGLTGLPIVFISTGAAREDIMILI